MSVASVAKAISGAVILSAFCMPAMAGENVLTTPQATYAAAASIQLIPQGDIEFDHHPHFVRVIDFNHDDVPEIVYLLTATNTGSTGDATNELVVMSKLKKGDKRGISPYRQSMDDREYAEIRKSGYANDVQVHIPGEVYRLESTGDNVEVVFTSKENSPICKRLYDQGGKPTTHCLPLGTYVWTYTWTPGKLKRVLCQKASQEKVQCPPGS